MKKDRAKKLLEEKLKKMDSDTFDEKVWTSETTSLIEKIFGKNSEEKKRNLRAINYVPFDVYGNTSEEAKRQRLNEGKGKASRFVNSYIEEIEKIGVPSESKTESMNMLKSALFWTIVLAFIGGAFTLGLKLGEAKFDKEKLEMYNQNRVLLNRLDSVSLKYKVLKDSTLNRNDSLIINQ
jgi:hypothetical protein